MTLFIKRFASVLTLSTLVVFGASGAGLDDIKTPDRPSQKAEKPALPKPDAATDASKKSDRAPRKTESRTEPKAEAAADDPKKSDRASQRAERRKAPKDEPGMSQKELNTCKRDAQGKDGPERARFMTDCLKD
jgi:hypothetical protein